MIIDCDRCVAKELACDGCVVHVFLRARPAIVADAFAGGFSLDDAERTALAALADAGLLEGGGAVIEQRGGAPHRWAS